MYEQPYAFNSQLWGELPPVVLRKGLQPVTLSLFGFPTRLLFPITAFAYLMLWYDIVCQNSSWLSRGYWRVYVRPPKAYDHPCYAATILPNP